MGDQHISIAEYSEERKDFLRHLLHDVQALDIMAAKGLFEKGITRIGAEQEFFIVDKNFKPSKNGSEILAHIPETHFTTELAKYNLEINLDPLILTKNCFSATEKELNKLRAYLKTLSG